MRFLVGIDEVGRGCLAGPVVVAAVLIPENLNFMNLVKLANLPPLRDSKKLSANQRVRWANWIKKEGANLGICYAISRVSPGIIDKINISAASNRAAWRSLLRLWAKNQTDNKITEITQITLDGGLYVKNKIFQSDFREKYKNLADFPIPETRVKADVNFPAVSLASIMAKTYRDRLMIRMDKVYPGFNFHINKGYGTKDHIIALKKLGFSEIHRRSFNLKK